MLRRWCVAAMVLAAVMLGTGMSATAVAESSRLRFDFDEQPNDSWDSGCLSTGSFRGCVIATGDALLRAIPHGDGSALRFPGKDSAVLRVAHDDAFNPGRDDFTISAQVRLSEKRIDSGSNVIQKGRYDSENGQWKLQVDSGVPSCRVAGDTGKSDRATAEAKGDRKLANGEWTSITCDRDGSRLRLSVDGEPVASAGAADVDIDNHEPVLIGGKDSGSGNDQFRGDLDDAGVVIDRGTT